MSREFRCRGCGEVNSIVEVSLVPRIVRVDPRDDGLDYGSDEAFWEAEHVLGYACDNESCEYWQGNFGNNVATDDAPAVFERALSLEDIAETVDA